MNLISAKALTVARGARVLLRGVEFSVAAGELLHVHGPNGCGKTTLLETLCGLRPPEAGEVKTDGEGALHWIGHRGGLNPALTVEENLRFWCALQDVPAQRLETALDRLGLRRVAAKPCGALSAGQKRRAALARLLLARRPLWLLDEPLASLDAATAAVFFDMLRAHLAQDGAAVLSSHQDLPADLPGLRRLELAP